jgi:hypothetical protein
VSEWGEYSEHLHVWLFRLKESERAHDCHLCDFHYMVTFHTEVPAVNRKVTPETSPCIAGCNLTRLLKQVGLWKDLVTKEKARSAQEAGVVPLPAQLTCSLCLSFPAHP